MKRCIWATAIVTALGVVAGCGGTSSSGDAPRPPAPDSAATKETAGVPKPERRNRRPNRATPAKPDERAKKRGAVQVPLGVPLDARSPQVRRAIAGLLHPDGENSGGSSRGNSHQEEQGQRRGVLGLLDQIRAAARERLEQAQEKHPRRSQRGGALHILEMLR